MYNILQNYHNLQGNDCASHVITEAYIPYVGKCKWYGKHDHKVSKVIKSTCGMTYIVWFDCTHCGGSFAVSHTCDEMRFFKAINCS